MISMGETGMRESGLNELKSSREGVSNLMIESGEDIVPRFDPEASV